MKTVDRTIVRAGGQEYQALDGTVVINVAKMHVERDELKCLVEVNPRCGCL